MGNLESKSNKQNNYPFSNPFPDNKKFVLIFNKYKPFTEIKENLAQSNINIYKKTKLSFLRDRKNLLSLINKINFYLNNHQNDSETNLNLLITGLHSTNNPVYNCETEFSENLKTLNSIINFNHKEKKLSELKRLGGIKFKVKPKLELYKREKLKLLSCKDSDFMFEELSEDLDQTEEIKCNTVPTLVNRVITQKFQQVKIDNKINKQTTSRSPLINRSSLRDNKLKINKIGNSNNISRSSTHEIEKNLKAKSLIKSNTSSNILTSQQKVFKIDLRKNNLNNPDIFSKEETNKYSNIIDGAHLSSNELNQTKSSSIIYKKKINSGSSSGFNITRKNFSNRDNILENFSQNNSIKSHNKKSGIIYNKVSNVLPLTKYSNIQTNKGSYTNYFFKIKKQNEKEKLKKDCLGSKSKSRSRISKSSPATSKDIKKYNLNKSSYYLTTESKINSKKQPNDRVKLNLSFENVTNKKEKIIFKIDLSQPENEGIPLIEDAPYNNQTNLINEIKYLKNYFDKDNYKTNQNYNSTSKLDIINENEIDINENLELDKFSSILISTPKFEKKISDSDHNLTTRFSFNMFKEIDKKFDNKIEPNIRYNFEINEKIDEGDLKDIEF